MGRPVHVSVMVAQVLAGQVGEVQQVPPAPPETTCLAAL